MRYSTCLTGLVLVVLLPAFVRGAEKAAPFDPAAINRAIDRGVVYLKEQQNPDGHWGFSLQGWNNNESGMTALAGLTLLHCGVPPNDPAVQKAALFVRSKCQTWFRRSGSLPECATYSIAVIILFLDRLGEKGDRSLVRALTASLLQGQQAENGGWSYGILGSGASQGTSLTDNSNTQFALLGLWVGHRYSVPIRAPLARTANRFQRTQNDDGGWGYRAVGAESSSTTSMTCAGLVALALRHAAANADVLRAERVAERKATAPQRALFRASRDPQVIVGFNYLYKSLQSAFTTDTIFETYNNTYYTLWSLERTAVIYDLRTIGGVDWYAGGAGFLLTKQEATGGWKGSWGLADTCFALLFLRRANFLPDVTHLLKGQATADGPDLSCTLTSLGSRQPTLEETIGKTPAAPTAITKEQKQRHQDALDGLLKQLQAVSGAEQELMLKRWRDGEDDRYTPALAKAIAMLGGAAQRKARAALADRCTRLSKHERDEHLRADDPEIRRAAVFSCAVRDDHQHIGRIIELLQDKEPPVAQAAQAVLCSLSGKDFGPDADASQADRSRAADAWKSWWNEQANK